MTAPTESLPVDDFAAFVGLDWADQKHDLVLCEAGSQRCEPHELPHTPEAIDEWAADLRQRFKGRRVAICFEQTRGPIAYALLKYDFVVLFPLPPAQLSSYRQAFRTSRAKDDPTDAALLLDFLLRHREQLRPWRPDSPQTRELRLLAEHRRAAVDDKTAFSNRLTAALKSYFPQALTLVGRDVDTPMACAFLGKWSTLEAAQAGRTGHAAKVLLRPAVPQREANSRAARTASKRQAAHRRRRADRRRRASGQVPDRPDSRPPPRD
jgi:hypothetical protein